jgi:hypothetical protein
MRRFILKQNVERFEQMLRRETNVSNRAKIEALLEESRRELNMHVNVWTWTCPHLDISVETGANAEKLLDEVSRILGAKLASLQFWDKSHQTYYLVAHLFDEQSARKFAAVKDGDGTVSEAAKAAHGPIIVDDFDNNEAFAHLRDWARGVHIRAVHTTPLFGSSGDFLGTFSTHYEKPRALTKHERELNAQYATRFVALFQTIGRK